MSDLTLTRRASDRLRALFLARQQAELEAARFLEGLLAASGYTLAEFRSYDDETATITIEEAEAAHSPVVTNRSTTTAAST